MEAFYNFIFSWKIIFSIFFVIVVIVFLSKNSYDLLSTHRYNTVSKVLLLILGSFFFLFMPITCFVNSCKWGYGSVKKFDNILCNQNKIYLFDTFGSSIDEDSVEHTNIRLNVLDFETGKRIARKLPGYNLKPLFVEDSVLCYSYYWSYCTYDLHKFKEIECFSKKDILKLFESKLTGIDSLDFDIVLKRVKVYDKKAGTWYFDPVLKTLEAKPPKLLNDSIKAMISKDELFSKILQFSTYQLNTDKIFLQQKRIDLATIYKNSIIYCVGGSVFRIKLDNGDLVWKSEQ